MVSIQQKAALRCISAYRTVFTEAVCVLAGMPPIELVMDERKRVYSITRQIILLGSRKVQWVRRDERQVTLQE